MGIAMWGSFLKCSFTSVLAGAYVTKKDGAEMSLKLACTFQPDLISPMAAAIRIKLLQIYLSFFLCIHLFPLTLTVLYLMWKGQQGLTIRSCLHSTESETNRSNESWHLFYSTHRITGYFWCLNSRHWQLKVITHKKKCFYLISCQLNWEARGGEFIFLALLVSMWASPRAAVLHGTRCFIGVKSQWWT